MLESAKLITSELRPVQELYYSNSSELTVHYSAFHKPGVHCQGCAYIWIDDASKQAKQDKAASKQAMRRVAGDRQPRRIARSLVSGVPSTDEPPAIRLSECLAATVAHRMGAMYSHAARGVRITPTWHGDRYYARPLSTGCA